MFQIMNKFWKIHKGKSLDMADQWVFINLWNVLTILSCASTAMGSLIKLFITTEIVMDGYSECALFLGIGVMLSFIAALQNFTYSSHFNVRFNSLPNSHPQIRSQTIFFFRW